MIKLKVDEAQRILTIQMEGVISEADIDTALDMLQVKYPAVGVHMRGGEHSGFQMMLDWEKLERWEMGAKTVGTLTAKLITDAVHKLAVLADAKWSEEEPRLVDIAKYAQVRFFPPEQRPEALAWLSGQ